MIIEVVKGDITLISADAIVNAANSSLLGGGGVDGAIHRAAGRELLAECKTLKGCAPGDAKVTKGYRLPSPYVIHTVGPIWRGGIRGEEKILASCYTRCLELCIEHRFSSVAFSAISTGVYGYPPADAAEIAVSTVCAFDGEFPEKVIFVCFDDVNLVAISAALRARGFMGRRCSQSDETEGAISKFEIILFQK